MTQAEPSVSGHPTEATAWTKLMTLVLAGPTGLDREERGASLVEYALLMALIVVVCVAAIGALGGTASEPFSEMQSGF